MRVKARVISRGYTEGEAVVSKKRISFLGDVDPDTGLITAKDSDIYGLKISNKVLIFPRGRGSTVGSYILYKMKKRNTAPAAIINLETELIIAVGAIIAGIPLVDKPEVDLTELIKTGTFVKVNANEGWIEWEN